MLSMVDWPLAGRTEELAAIADLLSADSEYTGAVVVGGAGVGKSRLVAEAVLAAQAKGWVTHSVVGTAAAQSIPLGAFAQWVDGVDGQLVSLVGSVIGSLTETAEGRPVLVAVDDAQWLDETSAFVVHQLIRRRVARVVVTVRTGLIAAETINELWKDGLLLRLDLQPLSRQESDGLLAVALDGIVDDHAAQRMWELTRGNVLFLYQLVHHELQAGRLSVDQGVWNWSGEMTSSAALVDLVSHYVDAAPEGILDVVDLVALAEPLELGYLTSAVDLSAVEDAEQRDFVVVEGNSSHALVRFVHPLYGEVRRTRMGRLRAARLRGRLVGGMSNPPAGTKPADRIRLALLWLESDLPHDVNVLRDGAAEAFMRLDLDLTNRLCESALAAGAGIDVRLMYALSLYSMGHAGEAESILDALPPTVPPFILTTTAMIKAANRQFFLGRPEESWAVVDEAIASAPPELRPHLQVLRVAQLAMGARPAEAVGMAKGLNADWLDGLPAAILACGEVIALGDLGDPDGATAAVDVCVRRAGDAPQAAHQMVGLYLLHAHALVLGGELRSARALGQRLKSQWADIPQDPSAVAETVVGIAALASGDLVVAREKLLAAITNIELRHDRTGGLYLFWLAYAEALALSGETDAAVDALDQVEQFRHPSYVFVESNRLRVAGWVAAAQGRLFEAVALVGEAVDFACAHGQFAREVMALQAAIQFGDRSRVDRLNELSSVVQGPRAPLVTRWAKAINNEDGDELLVVSTELKRMGDRVAAADAAAHAAMAFDQIGLRRLRLSASARATRLILECGGLTPATEAAKTALMLSDREWEIAGMVSKGRTNRQIAEALFMSVRTVEGHIYRACSKLGVKSRSELVNLIAEFTRID